MMIHPLSENKLQDRFCPEIKYCENSDGSKYPCGYITSGINLPSNETINVLADAIFTWNPECRWFLITTSHIDCDFNEENFWPRVVVKEIIIGNNYRVRYIFKYYYREQSDEDMQRIISEHGRVTIGITPEQYQAGINALAEHRAVAYMNILKTRVQEEYDKVWQEIREIDELLRCN